MTFIPFFKEYWKKIGLISALLTFGSVILMILGVGRISVFGFIIVTSFGIGLIIEFLFIFFILFLFYYLNKVHNFSKYFFILFILLIFFMSGFDYDLMSLIPPDRSCNVESDCYATPYAKFNSPPCNTICVNQDWESYKPIIPGVFASAECLEYLNKCGCINNICTKVDLTCEEYCTDFVSRNPFADYSECLESC